MIGLGILIYAPSMLKLGTRSNDNQAWTRIIKVLKIRLGDDSVPLESSRVDSTNHTLDLTAFENY